jgi:excinuclease ABC subunit A
VIKTADYVIDLGPAGGDAGGRIIATGTPEEIAATTGSYTGDFLRPILPVRPVRVAPASRNGRRAPARRNVASGAR